jgi:glycosyltransferase involved in cell wall biosynthesis
MRPEQSTPLVSVCIQTYQHAPYIRECLESVVNQQTGFPFEVIIGEDDSTDGTREICIEFAQRYPDRIKLFLRSEKEKIYVDGEKTGRFNFIENLKAARGKYIATLDGDDYWMSSDKLEKQVHLLETQKDCSLCFHSTLEQAGDHLVTPAKQDEAIQFFSISDIMQITGRLTLHTSNLMFRRETIREIPQWFYEVPFLDVPLSIYTGTQGNVGFVPEVYSVYRVHRKGMWLSAQEPRNYIKQWKLFTIMSRHFTGGLQEVLITRRKKVGTDLTRFYKKHRWFDQSWLRGELAQEEFPGDGGLLSQLEQRPRIGDYIFNIGSYSKKIIQRLTKTNS